MSTTPDESALQDLSNRLARLEQANADLQEKLATIQAERAIAGEQPIPQSPVPPPPGPPGAFISALSYVPAVNAIGTQGADGIDASAQISGGFAMHAVAGTTPGTLPTGVSGAAIFAEGGFGSGIVGTSSQEDPNALAAGSAIVGVYNSSAISFTASGDGVQGICYGGTAPFSAGVEGDSDGGVGVKGVSRDAYGVLGFSLNGYGVYGESFTPSNNFGVVGKGANAGVYAFNANNTNAAYLGSDCCAGWFAGQVHVNGLLTKLQGMFQIDHPLDPANKYLLHSGVESAEMKNIYDGVVVLDTNGEAVVELPDWFEPLNTAFRYQLTPLGTPGPNLYIAEEISNSRFKIAGGMPSMKVCWQVTGIRQDAWAKAHPMQVEEEKTAEERGHYLHPELHGAAVEKSIERVRHPQPGGPGLSRLLGDERSDVLPFHEGRTNPPQAEWE